MEEKNWENFVEKKSLVFSLISFVNFGFETNLSAVTACFNNIGPAFGFAGPMGSFSEFSDFSKIVLSFAMLLV